MKKKSKIPQDDLIETISSLEQQNKVLQARIKDLEQKVKLREPPIKRMVFSLSIRDDVLNYLKAAAQEKRWSVAAIIEQACVQWIERYFNQRLANMVLPPADDQPDATIESIINFMAPEAEKEKRLEEPSKRSTASPKKEKK